MDPSSPAPWTFAGRARYFGDQVCPFCDHHARPAARFCDACGSPLHLKPCDQCDAVNGHAATSCHKCGAEYPALVVTPEITPEQPAADQTLLSATYEDGDDARSGRQPPSAAPAGGRLLGPGRFFLAYVATILIAGVYATYRLRAPTPDATVVASQPAVVGEGSAQAAVPALRMAPESKAAEPETTTAIHSVPDSQPVEREAAHASRAPISSTKSATSKRVSARQRPAPVSSTKHASAAPRPRPQPNPWQALQVSLAQCNGDLINRIVCEQRVRRRFCEGHWGEAPECASVVASDRGQ